MNQLACELNAALEGTLSGRCLSRYGRELYFPKGIVAQAVEAAKLAKTYNATVGMAFRDGELLILPSIQDNLPYLTPEEAVGYAPTAGDPRLRKLWREEMMRKNPGLNLDFTSLPSVVPGITGALSLAGELFVEEGDAVFFPDLSWDNYELMFTTKYRARTHTFPLFLENGNLNISGVADLILLEVPENSKAVLILNYPHNPTGYSPTQEEARAWTSELSRVANSGRDIIVILDDAYFGLFYEKNVYRQSLFTYLHDAHERLLAVKCDGATKEDYVWGFRVGFFTLGSRSLTHKTVDALDAKVKGAIRASVSNSSRVAQSLLYKELTSHSYHSAKEDYAEMLAERYAKVRSLLAKRQAGKELVEMPFNSGYFMCFKTGKIHAEKLRKALLEREGIGTIALDPSHLRVTFAAVDLQDIEPLYAAVFKMADELLAECVGSG